MPSHFPPFKSACFDLLFRRVSSRRAGWLDACLVRLVNSFSRLESPCNGSGPHLLERSILHLLVYSFVRPHVCPTSGRGGCF